MRQTEIADFDFQMMKDNKNSGETFIFILPKHLSSFSFFVYTIIFWLKKIRKNLYSCVFDH